MFCQADINQAGLEIGSVIRIGSGNTKIQHRVNLVQLLMQQAGQGKSCLHRPNSGDQLQGIFGINIDLCKGLLSKSVAAVSRYI